MSRSACSPSGGREEHVADLLEAGGAAELLLGVREHLRAADGEPDPDLVRVVLPHVGGRVLRRPAAELPLLDERDLPEAELRQEVGGARAHDPAADHDSIGLVDHAPLLSSRRDCRRGGVHRPVRPDHDAVALARGLDAHLLVGDVGGDRVRLAHERVAPAAAARGAVDIDVARLDRDREHRGQRLLRPVRPERGRCSSGLRRRRPRARTEAVRARSERTISDVPGVRHRQTRSIARPPRCSPAPPVSGTSP